MRATVTPTSYPWTGFLRLHANDLTRLQRLIDPLFVATSFNLLVLDRVSTVLPLEAALALVVVAVLTALILPQGKLYQSYRQHSLLTLLRRLSLSWLVLLAEKHKMLT